LAVLRIGSSGPEVQALQRRLVERGFSPGAFDGLFGRATEASVLAFQRSEGLLADGIAGPRTLAALGLSSDDALPSVIPAMTPWVVAQMCPDAPIGNVAAHLPPVLAALTAERLVDQPMVLTAIATIRAETGRFEPIDERRSRFNTSPDAERPFDLYDFRKDLGNLGPPDGERFKGRGFVQLTGRSNYEIYDRALGLGGELVRRAELANEPAIAARLLARFLKDRERPIKQALVDNDLARARRQVNGGTHGLAAFTDAYRTGKRLIG
jgi:peptidoglycan L-alanyl-D-glutamate endopeptidase CwlK